MVRKLFIVGLMAASFIVAAPVFAQEATPVPTMSPEFNPLCWKRGACEKQRSALIRDKGAVGGGFITGNEAYPCIGDKDNKEEGLNGGEWGRCLPANVTETEIAFGGEKRFVNLGDFLLKNYNLAIGMAGIVAAIVIILSGFQWAMSGGNAETISSSKGRITNAIIGMFIAYTSYFILNTINPDLVNLRLPQTWLLRPLASMPRFCYAAPKLAKPQTQFALATKDQNIKDISPSTTANFTLTWDDVVKGPELTCGSRYFMKDGGSATCYGSFCGESKTCVNININDPTNTKYFCDSASVVGQVSGNYLPGVAALLLQRGICSGYIYENTTVENSWLSSGMNGIYKVCQSAANQAIYFDTPALAQLSGTREDLTNKITYYKIGAVSEASLDNKCQDPANTFLGYGLVLQFNYNCSFSKSHLISKTGDDLGFTGEVKKSGEIMVAGDQVTQDTATGVPKPAYTITSNNLFKADEILNGQNVSLDVVNLQQKP